MFQKKYIILEQILGMVSGQ